MDSETVFFPLLLTTKTCAVSLLLFCFSRSSFLLACRQERHFHKSRRTSDYAAAGFSADCARLYAACGFGKKRLDRGLLENFGLRMVFSQTGVILAAFIAGLPLVVKPLQAAFEHSGSERTRGSSTSLRP